MVLNFPLGIIFLGDGGAHTSRSCSYGRLSFSITARNKLIFYTTSIFLAGSRHRLSHLAPMKLGNPTTALTACTSTSLRCVFEIRFFWSVIKERLRTCGYCYSCPLISAPQVLGVLYWGDLKASIVSTVGMGLLLRRPIWLE